MIKTLPKFLEPVSSSVWAPDGRSFVTGCLAPERNLCQWSVHGDLLYDWGRHHRIQDLAVSSDGHILVAMDHLTQIHVYNFITREFEYEIDLKVSLSSISISQDSRTLLVLLTDGHARLIDLETRETIRVFRSGEEKGQNVIKACFGGANESFVLTGSESKYRLQDVTNGTDHGRWRNLCLAQGQWNFDRKAGRSREGQL